MLVLSSFLLLSFCEKDETISGFVGHDTIWHLVEMNDVAYTGDTIIRFPGNGDIVGKGPCNTYSTDQIAQYPWFETTEIRATKMACPELALEQEYFTALKRAGFAEVFEDTLILSNEADAKLVFTSR